MLGRGWLYRAAVVCDTRQYRCRWDGLFGLNDNSVNWNFTRVSQTYTVGQNGDGNSETILSVDFGLYGSCSFADDTPARPTNSTFELRTSPDIIGEVTCYIRIDD